MNTPRPSALLQPPCVPSEGTPHAFLRSKGAPRPRRDPRHPQGRPSALSTKMICSPIFTQGLCMQLNNASHNSAAASTQPQAVSIPAIACFITLLRLPGIGIPYSPCEILLQAPRPERRAQKATSPLRARVHRVCASHAVVLFDIYLGGGRQLRRSCGEHYIHGRHHHQHLRA